MSKKPLSQQAVEKTIERVVRTSNGKVSPDTARREIGRIANETNNREGRK
jgi:CHASE3 domain sensor protein